MAARLSLAVAAVCLTTVQWHGSATHVVSAAPSPARAADSRPRPAKGSRAQQQRVDGAGQSQRCTLRAIIAAFRRHPPSTLHAYLDAVYGNASDWHEAVERASDFLDRLDRDIVVVWTSHLPQDIVTHCGWPASLASQQVPRAGELYLRLGPLMRPTMAVYIYRRTTLCNSTSTSVSCESPREPMAPPAFATPLGPLNETSAEAVRVYGLADAARWVEVQHVTYGLRTPHRWYYRTPGSGLWYRMGRTLVLDSHLDLVRWSNAQHYYDPIPLTGALCRWKRTRALSNAHAAGYDTVMFVNRCDHTFRPIVEELVELGIYSGHVHRCGNRLYSGYAPLTALVNDSLDPAAHVLTPCACEWVPKGVATSTLIVAPAWQRSAKNGSSATATGNFHQTADVIGDPHGLVASDGSVRATGGGGLLGCLRQAGVDSIHAQNQSHWLARVRSARWEYLWQRGDAQGRPILSGHHPPSSRQSSFLV